VSVYLVRADRSKGFTSELAAQYEQNGSDLDDLEMWPSSTKRARSEEADIDQAWTPEEMDIVQSVSGLFQQI
jgi:hypothetical protein